MYSRMFTPCVLDPFYEMEPERIDKQKCQKEVWTHLDLEKEIPASSSTPFQNQNFHVQQMSPLQRLHHSRNLSKSNSPSNLPCHNCIFPTNKSIIHYNVTKKRLSRTSFECAIFTVIFQLFLPFHLRLKKNALFVPEGIVTLGMLNQGCKAFGLTWVNKPGDHHVIHGWTRLDEFHLDLFRRFPEIHALLVIVVGWFLVLS